MCPPPSKVKRGVVRDRKVFVQHPIFLCVPHLYFRACIKEEEIGFFDRFAKDGLYGVAVEVDLELIALPCCCGGDFTVGLVVEQDVVTVFLLKENVDDALQKNLIVFIRCLFVLGMCWEKTSKGEFAIDRLCRTHTSSEF